MYRVHLPAVCVCLYTYVLCAGAPGVPDDGDGDDGQLTMFPMFLRRGGLVVGFTGGLVGRGENTANEKQIRNALIGGSNTTKRTCVVMDSLKGLFDVCTQT